MKIALAVFVKTPGLSPIKTRLAKSTTIEFASDFYDRSLACTSSFLESLKEEITGLDLYWAIAEEQGLTSELWKGFSKISQGEGDLGMRLSKVYSELIDKYDAVFFMGADSPHLSCIYIVQSIRSFLDNKKNNFLMGKTSDGGYYFFGGKISLPNLVWLNIRYSTIHTASDFTVNLIPNGEIFYINDSFDIDEKDDFNNYLSQDFSSIELSSEQKKLISWIKASF